MKRSLLPVMMLFCLSSLIARPTLVVTTEGEGFGYALMAGVVERVAEHSLLSRMDGKGVLTASISDLLESEPNTLSAHVQFTYGERVLRLTLSGKGEKAKHIEKALARNLSSMLLYDGLALFETGEALAIDYTYKYGYATLSALHKGERYTGIDAQGQRWATAVVRRVVDDEQPVSLLVGTSGKELLPGMRLKKQAGRAVSLSVFPQLEASSSPSLGIEVSYSQEVGLYPFVLVLGGGFDLTGSTFSGLYGQGGVAVHLPLSMVFSLNSGFWRNSSFVMRCNLGLGYSLADSDLIYGSSASLAYRYALQGLGFAIGLGNKHWASQSNTYSSGLFMQLGLTYTW